MNNKNLIAVISYALEQATTSDIPILDGYNYDTMDNDKREQQIAELKEMLETAKQADDK